MHLDKEEEKILNGEQGYTKQKAMEILVALGDIYGAENLIPITSAHVSGVSYKTIGEPGIEFLKDFARDAKVSVKTTVNPCGMDLVNWSKQGIGRDFAKRQGEIIKCFEKMGCDKSWTCIPYITDTPPRFGEHVAWGESSAICYANSMIGARTNREGGPSALAAAIIGKTPNYGMHLDEGRVAKIEVVVKTRVKGAYDFGLLGRVVVPEIGNKIPRFKNIPHVTVEEAKALSASLGVGSASMFQIEGITPEHGADIEESITVDEEDLLQFKKEQNDAGRVEMVAIGCPHCTLQEIKEVAAHVKNKKASNLWVCTARSIKEQADRIGYTKIIESAGGMIVCDTCMVVAPLTVKSVGTNSGKAAYYLENLGHVRERFDKLDRLV